MVPIPCMYLVLAVVLGIGTPEIDTAVGGHLSAGVGLDSARDVLTSTATGMIAFTGLVVAAVLLVVQFAAGQYSPRLVLWFGRDRLVKHAIGSFLAAPLFALFALREIELKRVRYSPDITVVIALVLLLGAAVLFLVLLQRILDQLRPRSLYAGVAKHGIAAAHRLYPPLSERSTDEPLTSSWRSEQPGEITVQRRTGVLAEFNRSVLVELARRASVTLELVPGVGEFIWPGQPLFRVHGAGNVDERLLRLAVTIRDERTIEDDPAFALRIIVDTAIRALSPAVNDPTTAVHGLDALELLMCEIARRNLEASHASDDHSVVRLVWRSPSWPDLVSLAFDEVRVYGADSIQVCRRLRAALDGVRAGSPPSRRPAIDQQLEQLRRALERSFPPASAELVIAAQADRTGLGLTAAA